MADNDLTTEHEIAEAVLKILANTTTGEAKLAYLKKRISNYVSLTPTDRKMSETRPNEEMWEQRLRNIRSHRKNVGNYIHEGYLTSPSRGRLRITEAGRRRVS